MRSFVEGLPVFLSFVDGCGCVILSEDEAVVGVVALRLLLEAV